MAATTFQKISHFKMRITVSILQNVWSIHIAICWNHPPCKMFAANTLQMLLPQLSKKVYPPLKSFKRPVQCWSVQPTKCFQHSPCKMFAASICKMFAASIWKMFAASTMQKVCSVYPAKYLQPQPQNRKLEKKGKSMENRLYKGLGIDFLIR